MLGMLVFFALLAGWSTPSGSMAKACTFSRYAMRNLCPELGKICSNSNECGTGGCYVSGDIPAGATVKGTCDNPDKGFVQSVEGGRAAGDKIHIR